MKLSTKTAAAAAIVVALSSACSTHRDLSPNDDSRVSAHLVGEQVDVATINSRATYLLTFPHVKDGAFTVNVEIDCIECTKWMPGRLVLVKDDGSRVKSARSSIDLVDYLAPLEVRRGEVSFDIHDLRSIDRIVLMRGEPLLPVAKWKVDQHASVPTLEPEAQVELVALGDVCTKPGSTAKTPDGEKAYCSRLDYTDTYLWAQRQGVIPNEPVEVVQKAPVVAAKPKPSRPAPPPPPPPIIVLPPLPPWLK